MMPDWFREVNDILPGWITSGGVIFTVWQVIAGKRAAIRAAEKAEAAAKAAAVHAASAVVAITGVAENVQKIETATNSAQEALLALTEKSAGLEGEARGREQEMARRDAEKKR